MCAQFAIFKELFRSKYWTECMNRYITLQGKLKVGDPHHGKAADGMASILRMHC